MLHWAEDCQFFRVVEALGIKLQSSGLTAPILSADLISVFMRVCCTYTWACWCTGFSARSCRNVAVTNKTVQRIEKPYVQCVGQQPRLCITSRKSVF